MLLKIPISDKRICTVFYEDGEIIGYMAMGYGNTSTKGLLGNQNVGNGNSLSEYRPFPVRVATSAYQRAKYQEGKNCSSLRGCGAIDCFNFGGNGGYQNIV